jgi:16S rRNA processing protein RimM
LREPDWLIVADINNTHGIRGEVRVTPRTDFPEIRFAPGARLLLRHPGLNEPIPLTVEHCRNHKKGLLLKFREWDNINQAEPYKGGQLVVDRSDTVESGEGEYYFFEIIGCEVVTTEGRSLGKITDVLETGANDVWVVRPEKGGRELLIPYIDDVVKEVDVDAKHVVIQWMEGLDS